MNILITGAFDWCPYQIEALRDLGLNVYFLQQEKDPIPLNIEDVDAVICNGLFLHHSISKFPNLKYIQLTSAGFDRVPMDEVNRRGIKIHNARGVYSIPMAEWVLCKVLDIYKGTKFSLYCQDEHRWQKNRNLREIDGKKIAILGAGNVGTEVAKKFRAFGATIVGYDIKIFDNKVFDQIRHVSELVSNVGDFDIIILTLPLTPETKGLIGYEILNNVKENSLFVNIARGAIVKAEELISILKKRTDITAILDVFDSEPLSAESPLWDMDNVVVSPHNSFISDGNNYRMFKLIMENLKRYIAV